MIRTLVAGAGTIGTLICSLLVNSGDYEVFLIDVQVDHLQLPKHPHLHTAELDVSDAPRLKEFLIEKQISVIISSLPYYFNIGVASVAGELDINYFDLTEDVAVTAEIKKIAQGKNGAFVSQCGVAPGFINIVANDLMMKFDHVHAAYLRAGCLPKSSNNALQYAITWSIDGLINEYGNVGYGIVKGEKVQLQPLDDLEMVELDGTSYEAFNTSGGIGSLADTYQGKVATLNYKTLRYPGHCEKIRFLMKDLLLNEHRSTLKAILERALPRTDQDVMLVYVAVTGEKSGQVFEESFVKKIEPKELHGRKWSAIQISTASSVCAIVDLVMHDPQRYHGFILQEQFSFHEFLSNRFGAVLLSIKAT